MTAKFINEVGDAVARNSRIPRIAGRAVMWLAAIVAIPALGFATLLCLCVAPRRFRQFMREFSSRNAVDQVIGEARLIAAGEP